MSPNNSGQHHPIGMSLITAWTSQQAHTAFPNEVEDHTCSIRCNDPYCYERLWLIGSWFMHCRTIIECPKCGRLHLTPHVRRKDLENNHEATSQG